MTVVVRSKLIIVPPFFLLAPMFIIIVIIVIIVTRAISVFFLTSTPTSLPVGAPVSVLIVSGISSLLAGPSVIMIRPSFSTSASSF